MIEGTSPSPPDRALGVPVWQQVHDDLRRRMDAGAFGERVPGEHTLAEQYGVSRQTVRQALRPLREAGLLTAGRGQTSQVGSTLTQPLGAIYSLFASVRAAGMSQRSHVLALDTVVDPDASAALRLPPDAELVHLARLRLADDVPLAIDEAWLPASRTRALLDADFRDSGLYPQLDRCCGIHVRGGREQLHAVVVSGTEAELLDVPVGSAAFLVERWGCADSVPVERRRSLVRADRFSVTAEFAPGSGYHLFVDGQKDAPHARVEPGTVA